MLYLFQNISDIEWSLEEPPDIKDDLIYQITHIKSIIQRIYPHEWWQYHPLMQDDYNRVKRYRLNLSIH